jgi:hypothetical protein
MDKVERNDVYNKKCWISSGIQTTQLEVPSIPDSLISSRVDANYRGVGQVIYLLMSFYE